MRTDLAYGSVLYRGDSGEPPDSYLRRTHSQIRVSPYSVRAILPSDDDSDTERLKILPSERRRRFRHRATDETDRLRRPLPTPTVLTDDDTDIVAITDSTDLQFLPTLLPDSPLLPDSRKVTPRTFSIG